nr:hypothetical protein [Pedobacter panaciterrae]
MKEAFNIKVGYGEKEVTLTILQVKENYFKVIYFGGVMGGVTFNGGEWDLVEIEEMEIGDLPLYEPELKGERLQVILNEATVDAIGEEIESYLSH